MTRMAGSYERSIFKFLNNWQTTFQSRCLILYCEQQCMKVLLLPYHHQGLGMASLFHLKHSSAYVEVSHFLLIFISLMTNDVDWANFHVLICHLYVFWEEVSIQIFYPFLNWFVLLFCCVFPYSECKYFFHILKHIQYWIYILQILSPSPWLDFSFSQLYFLKNKRLNDVYFINFFFYSLCLCGSYYLRNLCLTQGL